MTVRSTRPELLAGMFGFTPVQASLAAEKGRGRAADELGRTARPIRTSGNDLTD